jgi:hypothetical protein
MKSKKSQIYKPKPNLPSLVPPWLAGVLSAPYPRFGSGFGKACQTGALIFLSFASIIGLTVWRFILAAPRDTGFRDIFNKAIYLQPLLLFITVS